MTLPPKPVHLSTWTYRLGAEKWVLVVRGSSRADVTNRVLAHLVAGMFIAPDGAKFVGREDFIVPKALA